MNPGNTVPDKGASQHALSSAQMVLILGGARSGKSAFAERLALRSGKSVVYIATATAGDEDMRERIKRHQAARPADWCTIEEPLGLANALRQASAQGDVILLDCMTLWLSNWFFLQGEEGRRQALPLRTVGSEGGWGQGEGDRKGHEGTSPTSTQRCIDVLRATSTGCGVDDIRDDDPLRCPPPSTESRANLEQGVCEEGDRKGHEGTSPTSTRRVGTSEVDGYIDSAVAEIEAVLRVIAGLDHGKTVVIVSNEVGLGVVPAYALGRLYRDALGRVNQRLASAATRVYLMIAGLGVDVKRLHDEASL